MLQVSGLTQPPATALGKLKWNSLSLSLAVRAKYLHINNVVDSTSSSSSLVTRAPSPHISILPAVPAGDGGENLQKSYK